MHAVFHPSWFQCQVKPLFCKGSGCRVLQSRGYAGGWPNSEGGNLARCSRPKMDAGGLQALQLNFSSLCQLFYWRFALSCFILPTAPPQNYLLPGGPPCRTKGQFQLDLVQCWWSLFSGCHECAEDSMFATPSSGAQRLLWESLASDPQSPSDRGVTRG